MIEKYIELEGNQRNSRIELLEFNIKKLENLEAKFMKYTYSVIFFIIEKFYNSFKNYERF